MLDDALQAYYARDEERDRLAQGLGHIEFLRTLEVIGRSLPPEGSTVADIGGGPGRYTDWLVEQGFCVVHRDIVELHVNQVRDRHNTRVDAALGDARSLDLADNSVDAVLLLGPLYHLPTRSDRVSALREARRVVRPGGRVYAAAISRWAPRLHGMLVDRVHKKYPAITDMVDQMEVTGVMLPVDEASFNGYAHTPDQLRKEAEDAGLVVEQLVSVEGISFALGDIAARLDDETERALLFDTLRAVESVPELLGAGPHMLAVCRTA